MYKDRLIKRITSKKACIGVIGLGYVGLPLVLEFAKAGFKTIGIDIDRGRVNKVNSGRSYILDISKEELIPLVKDGFFKATTDYSALRKLDAVIICVPTPLRKTKEPDMSYIVDASEAVAKYLKRGQAVVLESTTYPGTTDEVILPILTKTGLKAGEDFFLGFSPERIDPGNKVYKTQNIPKVVSGVTSNCVEVINCLYGQIVEQVIPVSSTKVAEMVKLLENTFRSINIGLVNELALMCDKLNIDVWEVIEAAKTKPFGFIPFYPGPGWGGHCLGQDEYVFVKVNGGLETLQVKDFEHKITSECLGQIFKADGLTLINPDDVQILSFDLKTQKPCYQKIRNFFIRRYKGLTVKVRTEDNRVITFTDKHPHIVYNDKLKIKFARDLKKGDRVLVLAKDVRPNTNFAPKIDLIEHLKSDFPYKVRVKPLHFQWVKYKVELIPYLRKVAKNYGYRDFFRNNYLPLEVFLEAEKKLSTKRDELKLCTGTGNAYQEINAVIKIDQDFCRLIGYYLSEGCLTKDSQTTRVRFSFNRNETRYIDDVKSILEKLGISHSIYRSKRFSTDCIKVSSNLFGYLIKDILGCGIDSYTMTIPSIIFNLPISFKQALLSGILCGDGSVEATSSDNRSYVKNGHVYRHKFNTACVSYFTASPTLFQQVILLTQQLGFIPTIKANNKHLRFFGSRNLRKLLNLLRGKKKEKLEKYFSNKTRFIKEKSYRLKRNYALVRVKDIELQPIDGKVYSVEVENTNTFVTSNGIITHNCIPIDPIYLAWKARVHGFEPRFIDLSTQINSSMPTYVVERAARALNRFGKAVKGSKILIVGVAYKRDVTDTRESPALEIIQLFKEQGALVSFYDPYVPTIKLNGETLKSIKLTASGLRDKDCVLIVTDHSNIDYEFIVNNAKFIFDTRNALRHITVNRHKIERL